MNLYQLAKDDGVDRFFKQTSWAVADSLSQHLPRSPAANFYWSKKGVFEPFLFSEKRCLSFIDIMISLSSFVVVFWFWLQDQKGWRNKRSKYVLFKDKRDETN